MVTKVGEFDAFCIREPRGDGGMEGYLRGDKYFCEEMRKGGKRHFRVYPGKYLKFDTNSAYFETCGPGFFKMHFEEVTPEAIAKRLEDNLLGYYCAPNAATPEYVVHENIRKVCDYLVYVCSTGWSDKIREHADYVEFLKTIQTNALLIVQRAIEELHTVIEEDGIKGIVFCSMQDLCGEFSTPIPGSVVEDWEDYFHNWEFRRENHRPDHFVEIAVLFGGTNSDDQIVWLEINTSEDNWYLDAIAEVSAAKDACMYSG